MEDITKETPWKNLQGQVFLGDKGFVKEAKIALGIKKGSQEIPGSQRHTEKLQLEELFPHGLGQNKPVGKYIEPM